MNDYTAVKAEVNWLWNEAKLEEPVRVTTQRYMFQKKQSFSGKQYIDQIEKNAVYLGERTAVTLLLLAGYYHGSFPKQTGMADSIMAISIRNGQSSAESVLAFLWGKKSRIDDYFSYLDYHKLRELRKSSFSDQYLSEIEFACLWVQTHLVISNYLVTTACNNQRAFGSYSQLDEQGIFEAINQQTYFIVAQELGLANLDFDSKR